MISATIIIVNELAFYTYYDENFPPVKSQHNPTIQRRAVHEAHFQLGTQDEGVKIWKFEGQNYC